MAKRKLNSFGAVFATCNVLNSHESAVQSDLALTPRRVRELSERGVPVSVGNLNIPATEETAYLDPQFRRGCDLNTAWEISRRVSSGLIDAHKRDKKLYGD